MPRVGNTTHNSNSNNGYARKNMGGFYYHWKYLVIISNFKNRDFHKAEAIKSAAVIKILFVTVIAFAQCQVP